VPFFVRWPSQIAAGTQIFGPVHHFDIFRTALAAAGVDDVDPARDGVNLLSYLRGEPIEVARQVLFWRSGDYRVVRDGDWKLQVSARPDRVWLFNLADDPTEQNDLSQAEPERVARMRAMIEAHESQMPAPMWPALIEGPVRIDVPLTTPWSSDQEYIYWSN
jgi:arylsulfatase A-like enzyme